MTANTPIFGFGIPTHVLRMIEFHVEGFLESIGKCFARRIVSVNALVADRTHGNVGRRELRQVTTRAVLVAGKTWAGRVVVAMMTTRATDRGMLRARMQEFRIVLIVAL